MTGGAERAAVKRRRLLVVLALVALVAVGLWRGVVFESAERGGPFVLPEVGKAAPDFVLPDLGGQRVSLSGFKGRPVYLNFWATWCTYCREEFPAVEQAYRKYGATGKIVFLTIDVGEAPGEVRAFLDRNGYRVPVLLDREGAVARRYLVQGLPMSYLIGPDGVIRDKVVGALDAGALRLRLGSLLP